MRTRKSLLLMFAVFALVLLTGGRGTKLKHELRFGVEAAQQGLWREAIFRWEKYLKKNPDDARIRNNIAVAYESMGDFDRALREYRSALNLDPENKKIRSNYESFEELRALLEARSMDHGGGTGDEAGDEPGDEDEEPSEPGSAENDARQGAEDGGDEIDD